MSEEIKEELEKEETATSPEEIVEEAAALDEEVKSEEDEPKVGDEPSEQVTEPEVKEGTEETKEVAPVEGEEVKPEGEKTEPQEDVQKEEEVIVEEKTEPEEVKSEEDMDSMRAELDELKAQREEAEALKQCNTEVMKVENEFAACTNSIAQALMESFEMNGIDPSKSLDELKSEDPAKATLARQFIEQATELRANLEKAAMEEIQKHQNSVIFKVASRELEKMNLTMEQAQEAVNTFIKINNEIGIADLGEDLKMKVQLAAGRAKMLHPFVTPPTPTVPEGIAKVEKKTSLSADASLGTTEKKEPSVVDEVAEELKDVVEAEQTPAPVVEKPKLEDFEEGANAGVVNTPSSAVTVDTVLDQMAALPFKERTKFYKEHEDLINEAMRSIR